MGIGQAHQQHAADTGLQVLVDEAGRAPLDGPGQHAGQGQMGLFDGKDVGVDSLRGDQCPGVVHRMVAGVPRRHEDRVDVVRAEGVGRDGGYQRRVHAAR